ncbi:extensin-like domain-containing protein [Ancylobacter terrae]|uniref:extensin-like domain-containing protein n=1 Tax=Ancylobacter sp. sgz301288 TaxID=3342077 RepID=UPI00385DC585
MTRGVFWFCVAPLVVMGLSGCQFSLFEKRDPWRSEAEERCLAEGLVKPSAYTTPVRAIDGAGTCGMDHPFKVSGLVYGQVAIAPTATMACPATAAVDRWLIEGVQPAAMAWFGQPVVQVRQMSSYSCRNMNGAKTGKISEHAFGNALDIGGFVLADGREVSVKTGWKGRPDEQGFLRTVQASACERFTTVLAPGSNAFHYDHIHVDLMRHNGGRAICNPAARVPIPPAMPPTPLPPATGVSFPGRPSEVPAETNPPEEAGADAPHGVDPGYQPPQPAAYPAPAQPPYSGLDPYGAAQPAYPAPAYPPPPVQPPPRGLVPPAGVPMVQWKKGADPVVTGSTTRGYAPEPDRPKRATPARNPFNFLAPIEPPAAIPGED